MKAKKIIIPIVAVAAVAALGCGIVALGNSASKVTYADTVRIEQKSLEDKISVNGVIESSEKKNVYSKLNYQVENVNVSVGDTVKKGDVLCTINTEELQQQILQQQASVDSSGVNSDYNLSEAEQRYADAQAELENGENSLIVNAKKAVEQAEKNLEEAKRQESVGKDTTLPSNIQNADASVESAKLSYENSLKAYEDAENALKEENYSADMKDLKKQLDDAKSIVYDAENDRFIPELVSAESAYQKAKKEYYNMQEFQEYYAAETIEAITNNYSEAKLNYDNAKKKYDVKNLRNELEALQLQYDTAIESLEKARDSAKANMENAKLAYDNALAGYDNVQKQNSNTEENYGISVKNAEDALETAKNDYDLAVRQAESELASLKKAAEQQRTVSGLNDPQVIILENLKEKLGYAVVTAPCDGVVTAVNAEEGAAAAGPLFTIENIDDLKITASVGEYDIPYIKEGMDVVIRCDALGDTEFSGKVSSVSRTPAISGQSGTNYNIEVSISGSDERLLAGMNAKLSIISEQKNNALTVTYDALTTDEDGNDAIYIAEKGEDGNYTARLIPVEIGLETDYEIEVISDELKEGMYVLTDTSTVMDGSVIMINEAEAQTE